MRSVLLDTGPLVALLDRSDKSHNKCADFLKTFQGQFVTTEPVLTEVLFLLAPFPKAQQAAIDFILEDAAILFPQSHKSLKRSMELIQKYSNTPMDFADATLIVLAEETGIDEIFTLDFRGFSVYRLSGRKQFKMVVS